VASSKYEYLSHSARMRYLVEWAKAKAEGRAEGMAESVLRILELRGLGVAREERTRVLVCRDLTLLNRWIRRAATAASASEVFAD
jgi:hypothetical protein